MEKRLEAGRKWTIMVTLALKQSNKVEVSKRSHGLQQFASPVSASSRISVSDTKIRKLWFCDNEFFHCSDGVTLISHSLSC